MVSWPKSTVPRLMWSIARPGGGDDDVDAVAQRGDLARDRGTAVDGEHTRAQLAPVAVDGLGDLDREFAGGDEDEGLRGGAAGVRGTRVGVQALQQRQGERGGLAGSGRGLPDDVTAGEQRGDRLALDRGRLLVAEAVENPLQFRAEVEVGKRGHTLHRPTSRRLSAPTSVRGRLGADKSDQDGRACGANHPSAPSLGSVSTYVAVFALAMAYAALVASYVALRTLAKLRRATAVIARGSRGPEGHASLVEITQRNSERTEIVAEEIADLRAVTTG